MSTTVIDKPSASSVSTSTERQVVALHLGDEIYGVDISSIHTVLTPQPITSVPNVPDFVRGVMNLRGRILPVLDLRTRFGLPPLDAERKRHSRIVIVEAEGLTAGLIVDAVSEVIKLSSESIEPPSALLASTDIKCLEGIGRVPRSRDNRGDAGKKEDEGRLILLLNVVETLTSLSAIDFIRAA